jgi:hypothetical protein
MPVQRIAARPASIGEGIGVHRALPTRERRSIGAWCFLDHAGPAHFEPGAGLNVGAHPHIGLQTFTWMIEGELLHRDSLGNVQTLRPGEVNLMTAGRGISHTEESPPGERRAHAAQLWIALPREQAECDPAFAHHAELPRWEQDGVALTLLVGEFQGYRAALQVYSSLLCLDLAAARDGVIPLPLPLRHEHGLFVLQGEAMVDGERLVADELAYLDEGRDGVALELVAGSRALLLGGAPMAEPILMWWNFVAHDRWQIMEAQGDWERGDARFGDIPGYPRLQAPPLPWRRQPDDER